MENNNIIKAAINTLAKISRKNLPLILTSSAATILALYVLRLWQSDKRKKSGIAVRSVATNTPPYVVTTVESSQGKSQHSQISTYPPLPNGHLPTSISADVIIPATATLSAASPSSADDFTYPAYRRDRSASVSSSATGDTIVNRFEEDVIDSGLPQSLEDLPISKLCQSGFDLFDEAVRAWRAARVILEREEISLDEHMASAEQAGEFILNSSNGNFAEDLSDLLRKTEIIRTEFERKLMKEVDRAAVDMAVTAITELDKEYERQQRKRMNSVMSIEDIRSTDSDSYYSVTELADLSDLDKHAEMFNYLVLYKAALLELRHNKIFCRTLRTKEAGCLSDTEFLAKLHCLRLSFNDIFADDTVKLWMEDTFRELLGLLLIKGSRDPSGFYEVFDELINFCKDEANWTIIVDDLKDRGVKEMNFFDIVVDFILLDAFDDLKAPPSTLISGKSTYCQNRETRL